MDPQRRPAWPPFFNAECAVVAHSRPTLSGNEIQRNRVLRCLRSSRRLRRGGRRFLPDGGGCASEGAVSAGWIPEWIPVGASSLREVHDIDTNESALAFDIPPGSWRTPSLKGSFSEKKKELNRGRSRFSPSFLLLCKFFFTGFLQFLSSGLGNQLN